MTLPAGLTAAETIALVAFLAASIALLTIALIYVPTDREDQ